MLNIDAIPKTDPGNVIAYEDAITAKCMASGKMNVEDAVLLANIQSAIRRGHPQMRAWPARHERVCLVGSGPSLNETEAELRALVWDGAILVTMNGAYHWCMERNLRPNTQIVMDAQAHNARFLQPEVPHCRYVLASQCAPEVWDAVAGRPEVWIFHAVTGGEEAETTRLLDAFYGADRWMGVGGGTTVATRAMHLLRIAGYLRFDLFGVDCCWHGTEHHALPQPENAANKRTRVFVGIDGQQGQTPFMVSSWMLKQYEDFLNILRMNGKHWQMQVHGKGLLAHTLRRLGTADVDTLTMTTEQE